VQQGRGQAHALLVAFRKLADPFAFFGCQANGFNHSLYLFFSILKPVHLRYKLQVFAHVHIVVQGVGFGQVANLFLCFQRRFFYINATNGNIAGIRF
jgi:hypothetical protein